MYEGLKSEVMEWDVEPWTQFPMARDLCQKLLAFDVEQRISDAAEALAHPWLVSTQDSAILIRAIPSDE